MKGYLTISHRDRTEIYLFVISFDAVKPCRRISWFSFQREKSYSWTHISGIVRECIPAGLKAAGHCYFKKNLSIKKLAQVLSNHPFIETEKIKESQIKLIYHKKK